VKLGVPRFSRCEGSLDELSERVAVRRVDKVHRIHEREISSLASILGELIRIELGKRLPQPALERIGDRAAVLTSIAGEDLERIIRATESLR